MYFHITQSSGVMKEYSALLLWWQLTILGLESRFLTSHKVLCKVFITLNCALEREFSIQSLENKRHYFLSQLGTQDVFMWLLHHICG